MDKALNARLLLGVTGGIAAYKVAELARLLQRNNVDVPVAMTDAAHEIRHARHLPGAHRQARGHRPVGCERSQQHGAHRALARRGRDRRRPRIADFLAKLAHGLADDLLSTTCLARNCPLLVAPAMNVEMWENPATQRNVAQLRADGVVVPRPRRGRPGVRRGRHGPHERARGAAAGHPRLPRAQAARRPQGDRHRRARPSRRSTPCAASPTSPRGRWATPSRTWPRTWAPT